MVSPAIKRETDYTDLGGLFLSGRQQRRKPADRKSRKTGSERRVKKTRSRYKVPLAIAAIALMAISLTWGLQNRSRVINYWENTASIFPFDHSTPLYQPRQQPVEALVESDLITQTEKALEVDEPADEPALKKETASVGDDIQPPDEPDQREPKKMAGLPENKDTEISPVPPKPTTGQYYIIAGSFSKESNAPKLIGQLKSKGFKPLIADTNSSGMFRVAYGSAPSMKLAKEKLLAVRQDHNPDAWILRK